MGGPSNTVRLISYEYARLITFASDRAKFLNEWRSAGPTPDVEKIYEIDIPKDARMRQDAYR